ncbi:hypothetical protein EWM64_g4364 [Hericium alpestre]|uniref:Uncharacterized protein n=1 Tax=Hericium alpestre TaxID=135208 RepID=A0A4Z0A1F4_9AGAM|nr:hypothetical protein EWM64_g4364 [Hericium alpestre]
MPTSWHPLIHVHICLLMLTPWHVPVPEVLRDLKPKTNILKIEADLCAAAKQHLEIKPPDCAQVHRHCSVRERPVGLGSEAVGQLVADVEEPKEDEDDDGDAGGCSAKDKGEELAGDDGDAKGMGRSRPVCSMLCQICEVSGDKGEQGDFGDESSDAEDHDKKEPDAGDVELDDEVALDEGAISYDAVDDEELAVEKKSFACDRRTFERPFVL